MRNAADRRPARGAHARDLHGLRRDAPRRPGPDRDAAGGAPRDPGRPRAVDSTWQVPAAYDDGPMLFDATLQQGLEGIVSKRLSSRYVFGARSPNWLKFAHRHRRSYVVGGWRPQEGTSDRLAALLVGEPTAEGLLYRGRVGSGIGGAASRLLTVAGRRRSSATTARSPTRCRGSTRRARTGWSRVVVVDVETHGRGRARGCGSRRTAASAPTSTPEDL